MSFARKLRRAQRHIPTLKRSREILLSLRSQLEHRGTVGVMCSAGMCLDPRHDRPVAVLLSRDDLTWPRMFAPLSTLAQALNAEGNGQWARYLLDTPHDQVPAILFGPGADDAQVMRLRWAPMSRGGQC